MKEVLLLCATALTHPFEGYCKKLPDGGCRSYPDPASPLARGVYSKAEIESMSIEELRRAGHPWTIGYGSTGPDIGPDTVWTKEQAEERSASDLTKFALGALALSPDLDKEPIRRFAAIISFCYNCGLGNYKISTLRRRVNEGDWIGASEEILKWNKARGIVMPGLTRRRQAESRFLL